MKPKLIALLALLTMIMLLSFTAVAYGDTPGQPAMVGSQWAVYEQNTLPDGNLHFYPAAHVDTISTGVEFSIPDATAQSPTYVNYLLDTFRASLTESNTLAATISVRTSSPLTTFVGNPDGVLQSTGFVRLFFQSNLPSDGSATCVGGNANVDNYWWADASSYTFATGGSSGTVTMAVSLSGSNWSNICGQSGASNPGFDSALANIKCVGLSFGSGYFFANGMGVEGSTGTATFQLLSYSIS